MRIDSSKGNLEGSAECRVTLLSHLRKKKSSESHAGLPELVGRKDESNGFSMAQREESGFAGAAALIHALGGGRDGIHQPLALHIHRAPTEQDGGASGGAELIVPE